MIDEEYVGRDYFDARMNQMVAELRGEMAAFKAELRREMAEMRNRILLGALAIAALAVAVLSLVIALVD